MRRIVYNNMQEYMVMHTIKLVTLVLMAAFGIIFAVRQTVFAADQTWGGSNSVVNSSNDCSGVTSASSMSASNCGIIKYIVDITNLLSALVGVVVVISIVLAGIQYSTSGTDPSAVSKAKKRITNAIIALLLYIFMFSFLQWLVPGGIF